MHDILEGCAPYEVKELLIYYIPTKFLMLSMPKLNTFLTYFSDERNKPTVILRSIFDSSDHALKQKGNGNLQYTCT